MAAGSTSSTSTSMSDHCFPYNKARRWVISSLSLNKACKISPISPIIRNPILECEAAFQLRRLTFRSMFRSIRRSRQLFGPLWCRMKKPISIKSHWISQNLPYMEDQKSGNSGLELNRTFTFVRSGRRDHFSAPKKCLQVGEYLSSIVNASVLLHRNCEGRSMSYEPTAKL